MQQKVIQRLQQLGITELNSVTALNELPGNYVNLEAVLPNGEKRKVLDDDRTYLGCQVEIAGSEQCYGVAADENMIAVFRYGCEGRDAELVLWLRF